MPVTIYTRASCAPCKTVKMWLQRKGVAFTEKNVDDNPEFAKEAAQKSGFTMVPVITVGDQVIAGANLGLISKLLML
jgi:glutaredoxin 3